MDIQRTDTAVVFIDPQNDVLSETGLIGARSAQRHRERTVENIERHVRGRKDDG